MKASTVLWTLIATLLLATSCEPEQPRPKGDKPPISDSGAASDSSQQADIKPQDLSRTDHHPQTDSTLPPDLSPTTPEETTPSDVTPPLDKPTQTDSSSTDTAPVDSRPPKAVDCEFIGCVDVTKMGADPTGKTRSTAAIQAAIDKGIAEHKVIFFPSGTYLVHDTLRCYQHGGKANHEHWQAFGCVLVGSQIGSAPVIKLQDKSAGFGDPSVTRSIVKSGVVSKRTTLKALIHFWRQQKPDLGGSKDPELQDGARNYNQTIKNIHLDLGQDNPGAIGIRHNGAEGCMIHAVKIEARSGFSGLYSFPSCGGMVLDLEVIGGKHGIYAPHVRGGGAVVAGLRLSKQRDIPFYIRSQYPVTVAGFQIQVTNGPVFSQTSSGNDSSGHLTLIDGSLERTGNQGPLITNTDRSIYMENVYVKGGNPVVKNNGNQQLTTTSSGDWSLVAEYSYISGNAKHKSLVNGKASTNNQANLKPNAGQPPTGLLAKHVTGPTGFCVSGFLVQKNIV